MHQPSPLYHRHRFPGELINHAVWLYYRFLLSYRDVEELLAERGITVSYETIRRWCHKFGQTFADGLRRRRARPGDKWHIDEVQLRINGCKHWLWRAVDQEGVVLDILVQSWRNQEATATFLRRVLDGCEYAPRVVITDKLASYPGGVRRVLPGAEYRRHKGLNNRVENSHRPTRRRERVLGRFKSPAHAQQFLAPFSLIADHFRPRRHRLSHEHADSLQYLARDHRSRRGVAVNELAHTHPCSPAARLSVANVTMPVKLIPSLKTYSSGTSTWLSSNTVTDYAHDASALYSVDVWCWLNNRGGVV